MVNNYISIYLSNIDVWNMFVDLCTIMTPIAIAYFTYNYNRKQDRKIKQNQEWQDKQFLVEKKAKLQSCININSDNNSIQFFLDKDFSLISTPNMLEFNILKDSELLEDDTNKFIKIVLSFSNITNLLTTKAEISNISLFDNETGNKQFYTNLIRYHQANNMEERFINLKYVSDNYFLIESILLLSKTKFDNLKNNILTDNKKINIEITLTVSNQFNIINYYKLKTSFKLKGIKTEEFREYGKKYKKNINQLELLDYELQLIKTIDMEEESE